jgi:hypothetical protein
VPLNELEKWYQANRERVAKMGIALSLPSEQSYQYIDGDYSQYIFRFIDRGAHPPDIEIVDYRSAKTIQHGLNLSKVGDGSNYDLAIDFILHLP